MKLLEDLKLKFPLKEVAPYSFCIVVPGTEFDPDWEAELADHGYKCFNVDIDGKPVTLVRVVKTEKGSGEKTVYSPPTASTESETFPRRWPEKEEKRLLERWNQVKGTAAERSAALAPEFPGRTAQAIMLKAKKMRRERGLSRKYSKHSEKALEKAAVHAPVDTPVRNAPPPEHEEIQVLNSKEAEFSQEMREALVNDLLDIAQDFVSENDDKGEVVVRTIRYIRFLEQKEAP